MRKDDVQWQSDRARFTLPQLFTRYLGGLSFHQSVAALLSTAKPPQTRENSKDAQKCPQPNAPYNTQNALKNQVISSKET